MTRPMLAPTLPREMDVLVLYMEAEKAAHQDAVASVDRYKRIRAIRETLALEVTRLDRQTA